MKALVFSGGGALGAYQVGSLLKMIATDSERRQIYAGISVGSLNASFLAQHPNLIEGVRGLRELWTSINNKKVKKWTWLFHLNLFFRNYLYDSSPLLELIKENIDGSKIRELEHKLCFGYVDLLTGDYIEMNEDCDRLHERVLASCAAPPIFGPVELDGTLAADGGLRNMTPLKSAIQAGATEIDVFLIRPRHLSKIVSRKEIEKGPTYIGRSFDIIHDSVWLEDLKLCHKINNNLDKYKDKRAVKVRVCAPPWQLPFDPFDFTPDNLQKMINLGYESFRFQDLATFLNS